jgi:hypothetical protein
MLLSRCCLTVTLAILCCPWALAQTAAPTDRPTDNTHVNRVTKQKTDPAQDAAMRQSGLSESQARDLLSSRGYTAVIGMQAEPSSVWVWQADTLKDGKRVRVGIDYRGTTHVIATELGRPCLSPGTTLGTGSFRAGSGLAETSECSNR